MKKQTIILIVALILLLVLVGYIINDKIIRPYYQEQGILIVVNEINAKGTVPVFFDENNTTGIRWISIQQICSGGQG